MSQISIQSRCVVGMGKAHGAAVGPVVLHKTHRSAVGFPGNFRRAYTLIEVLVVAVVVVLMLGMALPVFRTITGSRSEAGASNIIASMLGRARTDAIGLQQPYGVAFLYNPSSQQSVMAEVYFPTPYGGYTGAGSVTVPPGGYFTGVAIGGLYNNYYLNNTTTTQTYTTTNIGTTPHIGLSGPALDIAPNTEVISLPAGIGVQTICNCAYNGSARAGNGYLSLGVILFDGDGRVVSMPYGISKASKLAAATGVSNASYFTTNTTWVGWPTVGWVGTVNTAGTLIVQGVQSQYGLVVYQSEAYQSVKSPTQPEALYTDQTTQATQAGTQTLTDYTSGSPTQQTADNWLDQNATPLLINRYTGTLVKGE